MPGRTSLNLKYDGKSMLECDLVVEGDTMELTTDKGTVVYKRMN
jgi:hypothetical protein